MTSDLSGKSYERIVYDIHRQFAADAEVTENTMLLGKSGKQRQIDLAIRRKVIGYEILIIVECKDYRRPVYVGKVDELIGKLDDVSAHKAVLVSDSGFTDGAIRRARSRHDIQLASVVDAANGKIRSKLHLPLKVTFSNLLVPIDFSFKLDRFRSPNASDPPRPFDILNVADRAELREFLLDKGQEVISDFCRWSAANAVDLRSGQHSYQKIVETGPYRRIAVTCTFRKTLRSFVNENIFSDGLGIYDHGEKKLVEGRVGAIVLEEEEIIRTWKEIDPDELWDEEASQFRRVSSYSVEKAGEFLKVILEQLD